MAHKLKNGNYCHKGFAIQRNEVSCSTGWCCEWVALGNKYDTLKAAVAAIENHLQR